MSIQLQFNEQVDVERLADVVGTNKKEFLTFIDGVNCCFQPLDPQFSTDIDGGFGKDFVMFCETCDIREGDRVIRYPGESGGELVYRVVGIEKFDFMGNDHMEVVVRIFKS